MHYNFILYFTIGLLLIPQRQSSIIKKNITFKLDIFASLFFSFFLNSLLVDTQIHQLNYSYNAISYYGTQGGCLT